MRMQDAGATAFRQPSRAQKDTTQQHVPAPCNRKEKRRTSGRSLQPAPTRLLLLTPECSPPPPPLGTSGMGGRLQSLTGYCRSSAHALLRTWKGGGNAASDDWVTLNISTPSSQLMSHIQISQQNPRLPSLASIHSHRLPQPRAHLVVGVLGELEAQQVGKGAVGGARVVHVVGREGQRFHSAEHLGESDGKGRALCWCCPPSWAHMSRGPHAAPPTAAPTAALHGRRAASTGRAHLAQDDAVLRAHVVANGGQQLAQDAALDKLAPRAAEGRGSTAQRSLACGG